MQELYRRSHASIAAVSAWRLAAAVSVLCWAGLAAAAADPFKLDRDAARWVEDTLKKLSLDEKVGQLIVPSIESNFVSTDSDSFDQLSSLVKQYHVGGFHVFGGTQPAPPVLLNPTYGSIILGQSLSAAFLLNRLQAMSAVPLLNTADFESGVGFRMYGATSFPRQMAMGAANDERLVRHVRRDECIEPGLPRGRRSVLVARTVDGRLVDRSAGVIRPRVICAGPRRSDAR